MRFNFTIRWIVMLVLSIATLVTGASARAAGIDYEWGSMPEADERPMFDSTVRELKSDIERAHERRNALVREQRDYTKDWTDYSRNDFTRWFEESLEHPFGSSVIAGRLALYREQRSSLESSMNFSRRTGERGEAWSAEHSYLLNELRIADYEAKYERLRLNAIHAYQTPFESLLGIDTDEFYDDTKDDVLYVLTSYGETFFSDLSKCVAKTLAHMGRLQLLADTVLSPLKTKGPYADTKGLFDDTIVWTAGGASGCIQDALRDGLVNATVAAFRKQFVDRMRDQGVEELVAEMWWSKAIWEVDPKASFEDRMSARYRLGQQRAQGWAKYVALRFEGAMKDQLTKEHFVLQAEEEFKSQLRGQWAKQIAKDAADVARTSLKARTGVLPPTGRAIVEAKGDAQRHALTAVENRARDDLMSHYENIALVVTQLGVAIKITMQERAFQEHEHELLQDYRQIVACLKVLNRRDPAKWSLTPTTLANFYGDLAPNYRRGFLDLCRADSPATKTTEPAADKKPYFSDKQCEEFKAAYYKRCEDNRAATRTKNCEPPPGKQFGPPGCWDDPRGCMGQIINDAIPCDGDNSRVSCGTGILNTYLFCQADCNGRLLAHAFTVVGGVERCMANCDSVARLGIDACKKGGSPPPPATPAVSAPPQPGATPSPARDGRSQVVSPNKDSHVDILPTGGVRMRASPREGGSDFAPGPNNNAPRVMQPVSGDWTAETRIRFAPVSQFQGAGIVVCFGKTAESTDCWRAIERQYFGLGNIVNFAGKRMPFNSPVTHLRLRKEGGVYTAWFSADGEEWVEAGRYRDTRSPSFVGVMTLRQPMDAKRDVYSEAEFDYVRVIRN
jgi:hypothetical protein